jgi:leucyl-tRNA synthetase
MLHGEDGYVMSKSRGNIILPEEVSKKYGIDTARLFLVSVASPDKDIHWSEKGIEGSARFMKKLYELVNIKKLNKSSKRLESKLNKSIKLITENINNFKYNLAIIKLRELLDIFIEEPTNKKDLESFLKLLSPFCPHIAEELWELIGNKPFISLESWPKPNESKIDENLEKQEQTINKTIEDISNISKIMKEKQSKEVKTIYIYVMPNELTLYNEQALSKRLTKK